MAPPPAETSNRGIGGQAPAVPWGQSILLSVVVAAFLLWLHAPAALMLGPLLAAIVVSSTGAKVKFPLRPFVIAQGVVGCLIARMVPLSIVGDILAHWQLFTVGVLAVVAASSFIGWLMTKLHMLPGTTALWGISPGAASIVAKSFGIAEAHVPSAIVWFPPVAWGSFAETVALAVIGPLVAQRLNIPAGAMLVPLVVGILLAHFGLITIELPTWLLAASYALIGWNIGLRFTRPLLIHATLALPRILVCVFAMIGLCGGVAALLVWGAGVDPLTAYLATSPGGADSVAIIAASSNVDVSFVMAM